MLDMLINNDAPKIREPQLEDRDVLTRDDDDYLEVSDAT
jgi:hypothetical protein